LFKSSVCGQQGFVYGTNVAGLQFHMEVKEDLLNGMTEHERGELTGEGYVQTEETVKGFIQTEAPKQSGYMSALLNAFIIL
jgi:GMP synthase-like glutamine amidotransferase